MKKHIRTILDRPTFTITSKISGLLFIKYYCTNVHVRDIKILIFISLWAPTNYYLNIKIKRLPESNIFSKVSLPFSNK